MTQYRKSLIAFKTTLVLAIPAVIGVVLESHNTAKAEPFIYLYPSGGHYGESKPRVLDGKYEYVDPSIGAVYKIMPGDALSKIIDKVYYGTNLKTEYLSAYIVKMNKHAFGGGMARFMFAGANLKLPSTSEIEMSIYKNHGVGGVSSPHNAIYYYHN